MILCGKMKSPQRSMHLFLKDIEDSIEKTEVYIGDMSKEKFFKDVCTQDAVIRCLEIIGEAIKNIPVAFKEKHPEVSWNKMVELGDVLEHALSGIDFERVWLVVKDDLPDLKKKIKKILEDMETALE